MKPPHPQRIVQIGFGLLVIAFAFVTGCDDTGTSNGSARSGLAKADSLLTYRVAMHLHGHSNHNGNGQPASMQWISYQAHNHDVADVLWWNDHAGVFDQSRNGVLPLSSAFLTDLDVTFLDCQNNSAQVCRLKASVSPDVANRSVRLNNGILTYNVVADGSGNWQVYDYSLAGERGRVKGFVWPRPVSSGATIRVHWETDVPTVDRVYEVKIALSWHHETSDMEQQLIYRLSSTTEAAYKIDEATTVVPVAYNPSGDYELALDHDAILMTDGDDNTISEIEFGVQVRNGSSANASLSDFKLFSTNPGVFSQLNKVNELASRYGQRFEQAQHVGVEYGRATYHLNAFLDDNRLTASLMTEPNGNEDLPLWVQFVHDQGGLVSMNHMFGTSSGYWNLTTASNREAKVREMSSYLLANKAFDADLIEVGYLARGGANLQDHLAVWDVLTANSIFLHGIGVTDTHGGSWSEHMWPNPFATWIQAKSRSAFDLLDALSNGYAYFGNPFLWNGTFKFAVGDAYMGGVAKTSFESSDVKYEISPFDGAMQVFVVQGLIKSGEIVEYLHERTLIEPGTMMSLDVSRPCFVRLEVYTGESNYFAEGEPLLFSNPVVFLD